MDALAEGDVVLGIRALEVDLFRVREGFRVTVRRSPEQHHHRARGDRRPTEFDVGVGLAEMPLEGRFEPQRLLENGGNQRSVRADALEQIRALKQQIDRVADQARRRLVAGDQ